MINYTNTISVEDYLELRAAVDWAPLVKDQAQSGIDNSAFVVACSEDDKIVGCARMIWDRGYIAYLADVMVKPEYQGQGIGRKLVNECISFIDGQLKEGWRVKIEMVSAKGKEGFYEKLGFKLRPNENEGHGMNLWRQ